MRFPLEIYYYRSLFESIEKSKTVVNLILHNLDFVPLSTGIILKKLIFNIILKL